MPKQDSNPVLDKNWEKLRNDRLKWLVNNGFSPSRRCTSPPGSLKETVEVFANKILFYPKAGTTWRDYAGEAVGEFAERYCEMLIQLANSGDREALVRLGPLTLRMVKALNRLALQPSHCVSIQPFARTQYVWPVMMGRRKALGDNFDDLSRALELSRENRLGKESASKFDPNLGTNAVLADWLGEIEFLRAKKPYFGSMTEWQNRALELPELSLKTAAKWREVIRLRIEESLKDRKEQVRLLKLTGVVKIPKSARRSRLSDGRRVSNFAAQGVAPSRKVLTKAFRESLDSYLGHHKQKH